MMPIHAVCVCLCVHTVHAVIYCIAMRKDNLKHKDNTHPSVLFPPSAVSHVCPLCRRELWETSVLQLCLYRPCGIVACTLLSDCHTAASSQYVMLHTVRPSALSIEGKSEHESILFTSIFVLNNRFSVTLC